MAKELRNRTKIVCTIGPSSSTRSILKGMILAGMNVARINFSHGDKDSNLELVYNVRNAAQEVSQPIAIMQDLQGPKIRVGVLPGIGLELIESHGATLRAGVLEADEGIIPVPYERFAQDLSRGDRILIADGKQELEVLHVEGSIVKAKVLLGGRVLSHRGINVPSVTLSVESLTEKDKDDLAFGLQHDLDFVALSFVRSAKDVEILREFIFERLPDGIAPPQIIVKIEKNEALEHFEEILNGSDGVMVARGDLGLETSVTKVPILQKELIARCLVAGKPVITATEMLASMEVNPRPTRAEVSDVANAVVDHTDAVMLSGETALGRYPVRAVETMSEIIATVEESPLDDLIPEKEAVTESHPIAIGASAVTLAQRIGAAAILVTTKSGFSARAIARYRPGIPVFAATESNRTSNQLLLSWGVVPFTSEEYDRPERMVHNALGKLVQLGIKPGSNVIVVSGLRQHESGRYEPTIRIVKV